MSWNTKIDKGLAFMIIAGFLFLLGALTLVLM